MEKIIETKICTQCSSKFDITDKDIEFYEKVSPVFNGVKYSIPTPTLCPECRQQRRLAWRNERKLYRRNCDATGKQIISIYSPDKPYKVYDQKVWWSDSWDAMEYGRDFDFNRGFFEQFEELFREVPKNSILNRDSENSEYTNNCFSNKNSYLLIESSNNEHSFYSYWLQNCIDCIDCSFVNDCNNCYEVINSNGCFNLLYGNNCTNCQNSLLLKNCIGCNYCIGCEGLNGQEYYFFNTYIGKEKFIEKLKEITKETSIINKLRFKFDIFTKKSIHKYANIINSKNCIGDYIINSNNCKKCFNINDVENCKNSVNVLFNSKDCYDVDTVGLNSSLIYESINTAINSYNNGFCVRCWTCSFNYYSENCDNSSNLFGCVGLHNKQYCILNKQYTREEYEILVPQIIEHMTPPAHSSLPPQLRGTEGEWGEFFPASISPFGYNETVAMEYYPLEKEKAIESSFNWSDYEPPKPDVSKIIPANSLPENIKDIPDDIINWAIECEVTGKPYRIIKQELEFYRKHNLPIPRKHPDQRHLERLKQRNPRKLFERKCDKCSKDIISTYSSEREEIVYCEECYEKEVL